jgi:hypothetical protein
MVQSYRDLTVWQQAIDLVTAIYPLLKSRGRDNPYQYRRGPDDALRPDETLAKQALIADPITDP